MRKLALVIIFALTFVFSGFSQDTAKINRVCVWVDLGAGFYRNTNFFRLGTATWLNVSHDNVLYKFRYESIEESMPLGNRPIEYSKNYALMVGKMKGNDFMQVSATLGLGYQTGTIRGDYLYGSSGIFSYAYYEDKKIKSLSVPFELDCTFKPLPVLSFGTSITGDLSPEQSTIGLLVKFGVGLFPKAVNL